MAIFGKESTYQFYAINTLDSLQNWNLLNNAGFEDGKLKVSSGGYAGYTITNTIGKGLTQCMYMYLQAKAEIGDIGSGYNYTNYVDVVLRGTYTLNSQTYSFYNSIPFTELNSTVQGSTVGIERVYKMPNVNFDTLEIYFKNHTDSNVSLTLCSLLRSKDVSSGQITDAINTSYGLQKVTSFSNGFSLLYSGSDEELKIWWVSDEAGKLAGLNVNNNRMVLFEDKHTEVLT